MSKRKIWTPEEDNSLIELYPKTSKEELASFFGVSLTAISQRAHLLGVRKEPGSRAKKSPKIKDIEEFKSAYMTYTNKELCDRYQITESYLWSLISKHKLKRPKHPATYNNEPDQCPDTELKEVFDRLGSGLSMSEWVKAIREFHYLNNK